MVKVNFYIFSGALSVIMQLTGSAIGKTAHNKCAKFGESCNSSRLQLCCDESLLCEQQGRPEISSMALCLCNDGFQRIGNKCHREQFCAYDGDCTPRTNTECSEDNECVCKTNYIETSLTSCRPLIGGICEETEECFPENSVCVNKKCQCKKHFVLQSNDRCVPTYFNWTCNPSDEICQEAQFFSCTTDGQCFCEPNYVALTNKCVPLLNEPCSTFERCITDNSICVNNKCQCKPRYGAQANNRCLPTYLYGSCKTNDDCSKIKNTKCSKFGGCMCRKNYYTLNGTTCSPTIGGACASNEDCTVQNSICIDNRCQCIPHLTSIIKTLCLPGKYSCEEFLHKACQSDDDCIDIKFTYCSSDNICICEPNYLASKDETLCLPLVGGVCERDKDCVTTNSHCFHRRCLCKRYYIPQRINEKYKCIKTFVLGIPCQQHKDCAFINNAQCTDNNVCGCRNNYYALENRTFCAPPVGENCFSNEDCRFNNFHCFNHTCQCKPNYLTVSDTRCEMEQSTVRCNQDIECGDPWHAKCSKNNNCLCKPNTELFNKATCYPLLKGLCWTDDQCILPNSTCIDYHCQCQSGFNAIATNLCVPK